MSAARFVERTRRGFVDRMNPSSPVWIAIGISLNCISTFAPSRTPDFEKRKSWRACFESDPGKASPADCVLIRSLRLMSGARMQRKEIRVKIDPELVVSFGILGLALAILPSPILQTLALFAWILWGALEVYRLAWSFLVRFTAPIVSRLGARWSVRARR